MYCRLIDKMSSLASKHGEESVIRRLSSFGSYEVPILESRCLGTHSNQGQILEVPRGTVETLTTHQEDGDTIVFHSSG